MRILLYEYVTGGGLYSAGGSFPEPQRTPEGVAGSPAPPVLHSLLREGAAMTCALAADLLAAGHEVWLLRDVRLRDFQPAGCRCHEVASAHQERQQLERLAAAADACLLIAPEFLGILEDRARAAQAAGGRLLSPGPAFIGLTADKNRCASVLAAAGVRVPRGALLERGALLPTDFPFPAVLKPADGAGSAGVQLLSSATAPLAWEENFAYWRLEEFVSGVAASVAVLHGPSGFEPLPACRQRLSQDGRFRYEGGALPLPPLLAERAARVALQACAALHGAAALEGSMGARGYVGLDLVLGENPQGAGDVVIEVNPRLTTSYLGLRRIARTNLSAAWLAHAAGEPCELSFTGDQVEFDSGGEVRRFTPQP